MEMLNVMLTAMLGFLAWIAISVVSLKTDTAVISVKVNENNKMLTTLWEDYIRRVDDGNLARVYDKTNIKSASKEKVEQVSQVKSKLQTPSWF
tara:strand:+ start:101 stop:379 length:279 start_codon:yes stop_codon:yes gene_type:complete